ncbi:PREDICTED: ethylene-responsive transcription factor ERF110-like [Nelumbo nucifera]|uniref:AP2/ERF domain-containing protein n=2 Tax=Nelumbo nucifera TaxID=4432 RepID=A0A822YWR7_NELNU|nr:PREDICTED: ethylene-responsive transcription factor ERF110-like [Nelumbo nucifera]DAD35196.1 TPA_asm: hypothetical protein HUJ06_005836 [Nelumbo nucifera]
MDSIESPTSSSYHTQVPCRDHESEPDETENFQESQVKIRGSALPIKASGSGRRFLGVRQRPSGRWVAEIKDSSQKLRLWLGTFDRAEEAAMAYDNAARLLRGRNARTNFPYHENMKIHERNYSLLRKNPRFSQLLQRAIMKNHWKFSSASTSTHQKQGFESGSIDVNSIVEETIVCSSSPEKGLKCYGSQERDGLCGFSFRGCKVYSSVIVSPSFSASQCDQAEVQAEERKYEGTQSLEPLFVHATGFLESGFVQE